MGVVSLLTTKEIGDQRLGGTTNAEKIKNEKPLAVSHRIL
jgi:hypothetical protein